MTIDPTEPNPFEDLEVIQHASGRLMFPAKLRRRDAKGKIEERAVRVCVPRPDDLIQAHLRTVEWWGRQKGLDRKNDAKLFDDVEQLEILALSVRENDGEYPQAMDRLELQQWDEASLGDILERINIFKLLVDPREQEVDEEQFFRTLLTMHRGKTILPLGDMAGPEQLSFIMRLVSLAASSPEAISFQQSLESSTPEP